MKRLVIGVLALVLIGCGDAANDAEPVVKVVDSDLEWEKGVWNERNWQ